jgi:2-keto-4-pentenoate hydratase/2-oxohepta-3-ene-1,7-dioic acid hydratase in catechol pathway
VVEEPAHDRPVGAPRAAAPRCRASVAEGEIAVVIGRDCTALTAATAERFVRA